MLQEYCGAFFEARLKPGGMVFFLERGRTIGNGSKLTRILLRRR